MRLQRFRRCQRQVLARTSAAFERLRDQKHAQNIARAVLADSPGNARLLLQDKQAREVRDIAVQSEGLPLAIDAAPQVH